MLNAKSDVHVQEPMIIVFMHQALYSLTHFKLKHIDEAASLMISLNLQPSLYSFWKAILVFASHLTLLKNSSNNENTKILI